MLKIAIQDFFNYLRWTTYWYFTTILLFETIFFHSHYVLTQFHYEMLSIFYDINCTDAYKMVKLIRLSFEPSNAVSKSDRITTYYHWSQFITRAVFFKTMRLWYETEPASSEGISLTFAHILDSLNKNNSQSRKRVHFLCLQTLAQY